MHHFRSAALVLALAGLGCLAVPAAAAAAAPGAASVSTLTAIRAGHHAGYDRLVFQFRGAVPAHRDIRYVPRVIHDFSGRTVRIPGAAKLLVRFSPAAGHDSAGHGTYGPARRTYALPGLIQVVNAGDFESRLSFGVGVARKEPIHVFTLTHPSRVVIDVRTPYRTVPVRVYLFKPSAFAAGHEPYTRPVSRPVIPPALARRSLQRLFAGPTQAEQARGLSFLASKATGFKLWGIRDGVARVQLTGACSAGGSTASVALEIMPTLEQFASVRWVKIYDPAGHTTRPAGHTDSIPECLNP